MKMIVSTLPPYFLRLLVRRLYRTNGIEQSVLAHVFFQELPCSLADLRRSTGSLLRSEGCSLPSHPRITPDGGEAYTDETGGPSFGHPALEDGDHLLTQGLRSRLSS